MRRLRLPLLFAALVAILASVPARAGLFDDDEARARIDRLRADTVEQGKRLEASIDAKTETNARAHVELSNQLEALKAELAKLNGQIEVLTYELQATQKRQKDFYVDLDARLRNLEAAAQQAAKAPAVPPPPAVDPGAEMRDYEAALTLFKAAKYKEALAALQDFIKNYGNSTVAASANFWAASTHFQLHEYARAADMFGRVAAGWPNDSKAPDAMLGEANSQLEAGDAKAANRTLQSLIAKYPASNAAQIAKQNLAKQAVKPKKK